MALWVIETMNGKMPISGCLISWENCIQYLLWSKILSIFVIMGFLCILYEDYKVTKDKYQIICNVNKYCKR